MSIWLDTRGKTSLAIATCDKCHFKMPWADAIPDPNYPGLRVHRDCADELDPYRLPARQTEDISLPWARPDAPIGTDPSGLISEDGNYFLITEDGGGYLVP